MLNKKGEFKMVLTKTQISKLTKETRTELLFTLYKIEDELAYNCKDVSKTINYIQELDKIEADLEESIGGWF